MIEAEPTHWHQWTVIPDGVTRTYECETCEPDQEWTVYPGDLIPMTLHLEYHAEDDQ